MRPLPLGASALVALVLGAMTTMPGCSGGSGHGGGAASTAAPVATSSPAPVQTQALTLVLSSPQDGEADVAVDAALFLTFDQDLDPATLPGAVTLASDTGPVAAVVSLSTPRVVSVTPSQHLRSITPHVLRVETTLADAAGRTLARQELVRFTTSPAALIVGGAPAPVLAPATPGQWKAGAAAVDFTPPVGVPLAGYGGGARRHLFPDLNPFNAYTFLNPSTGKKDAVMAKALVLDNGHERVAIVTLDAIATDAGVVEEAVNKARAQGFTVPLEKVLVCSSHTHSGPGCMTKRLLWEMLATDLFVRRVFDQVTDDIASALLQAEAGVAPARLGVASTQVSNATENRRASESPDLDPDSIDPEMLVIRVDRADGSPLATVWNFGIHGTHFGITNLEYSADIMGSASNKAEAAGLGICLFVNSAEGDIKPVGGYDPTGQVLADAIARARGAASADPAGILQTVHEQVDLGDPYLGLTLAGHAPASIAHSGFVTGLAALGINPGIRFKFPRGWVEREFRFQAIRIGADVIASMPGEPIHEIGLGIKQDGKALGFRHVLAAGLANGHGSYFTTAKEYGYGGYEGMASFFGPQNGDKLRDAVKQQMTKVKP
ncbi:MAG: neutral/alkaline non-lysosomal ceramidase N-terminal domain-containing protein [Planctomycetota bacterium]